MNLLPHVSKFLAPVTHPDIAFEQQRLEAEYDVKLRAHSVEHRGETAVLITWEIIE
jgi:hypothetical protein